MEELGLEAMVNNGQIDEAISRMNVYAANVVGIPFFFKFDSRQTSCISTPFNTSCLVFSFGNYKLVTK